MKNTKRIAILAICILLAACKTTSQSSVFLSADTLSANSGKVGVIMTSLPKVDTTFPGAGCLLCMAAANAANSSLTKHAHTLSNQDFSKLKDEIADTLRKKGVNVVVISEDFSSKALKDIPQPAANSPKKDFRPLRNKYQVDHLAVLEIRFAGFLRNYSAYISRGDPVGNVVGTVSVVNLSDNKYELFQDLDIIKTAEGAWDEPPDFPGLSNAYFTAVEACKDQILRSFRP
jgi:hypothetical protein